MSQKRMIKAAIFDMDGTIADSESIAKWVCRDFFKRRNIILRPEEEYDIFGLNWKDLVKEVLRRNGMEYDQRLKNTLKERYIRNMRKKVTAIPGIHKLLDELKKSIKLALATNSRVREVDIICSKLGLDDYFEVKLARNHVKKAKPDAEIYLKAAKSLDVRPQECIVFEDSATGIKAAKSAGMFCIAVINTYPKDMLFEADHIINGFDEINLNLLERLFLKDRK